MICRQRTHAALPSAFVAFSFVFMTAVAVTAAPAAPAAPAGAAAASRQPACDRNRTLNSVNFPNPPSIDNGFLPLRPGMRFVLTGSDGEGDETVARRVEITVTDLTKVIDGVRTIAVSERDFTDGMLTEDELAFRAQEDDGKWVWEFGEYPEEFDEDGRFHGAPSTWLQGVRGGLGGLAMPADPRTVQPSYLQAFAPGDAGDIIFDCARLYLANQRTAVPAGVFKNVLVNEEWSVLDPFEPHQLKYYAPGVGLVRVGVLDNQPGEKLVLTEARRLCRQQLKPISDHALRLDERAYTFALEVFTEDVPHAKRTLPVKPCESAQGPKESPKLSATQRSKT